MNPKTLAALVSFTVAATSLAAALKALVPPQTPLRAVPGAATHTLRVKAARAAQRGAWSLAGVSRRVHP